MLVLVLVLMPVLVSVPGLVLVLGIWRKAGLVLVPTAPNSSEKRLAPNRALCGAISGSRPTAVGSGIGLAPPEHRKSPNPTGYWLCIGFERYFAPPNVPACSHRASKFFLTNQAPRPKNKNTSSGLHNLG